jgi:methionyl aminopeptidase
MSITSDADWKGLYEVGRVVRLTLDALERHAQASVSTAELDQVAAQIFASHGARSAPAMVYGFPGTVLICINDEVVHGVPGSRRLKPGDVVKLDVTAEKGGYMADAARTVLVGNASRRAQHLRACVHSSFECALKVAKAGNRVSEIGRAIEREVHRHGFSVIRALEGHGIGRTIHEPPSVPNYWNPNQKDVLTEGLVMTIEPIISCGSGQAVEDGDGWTIRTKDGSLSAHYEHTVVITRDRPVLLTAA